MHGEPALASVFRRTALEVGDARVAHRPSRARGHGHSTRRRRIRRRRRLIDATRMSSGALVLEAEFSPGMTPEENQELARLAEDAGFDRLGISDIVLWPDTFIVQILCAQATRRIE